MLFFYGGDASKNGDFQRGKQRLQGTKFSDLSFYLQKEFFIDIIFFKYAIFIKFWCGAKFSNITKWQYFLDELNLKLKNKTCQEISKITKWHYVVDELNLKFKNKHVTIIFDSTSFGTLGKNWFQL